MDWQEMEGDCDDVDERHLTESSPATVEIDLAMNGNLRRLTV